MQSEGGDLEVLAVIAGQVAGLAVEDVLAGGVEVLHHVQALVDLSAQFLVGEVVADEDGADAPAEFFDGLVGGVPPEYGRFGPPICLTCNFSD
ncbi:hypothetical protein Airi01_087750 [Actinoallomurus iriomotensis]|uniref:Uncharacterized protein n=1 Tax=Actinoallomurus iriomotensis TaxID=478107 RepID=A0A9W6RRL9_9ACTN|nr:hypothetical protein Airi01_087750 [Actinoallomurus iriomotensis]